MAWINPYEVLSTRQARWYGVGAVVAVLVIWSAVAAMGLLSENKLPPPWKVAQAMSYLAWDGERGQSLLAVATMWSLFRVITAGLLVIAIGMPIGLAMGVSPRTNAMLSPLVDPFRSAPVVAFLPLFVLWFGIGELMKVLFLFVGAVVYLIPMVRDAIVAVPQHYWISARDLGASAVETVRHAVLPMAMPRIFDAIIVATSVLWTYITVAEYVNAREGLGQLIQNARRFSAMDQVFAGIIVIIALALLTYTGLRWVRQRLYSWEVQ